jgi:MFS transporter, NNP family, nitrate/nitrite transporter
MQRSSTFFRIKGRRVSFKEFKEAGHWPTLLSAFLYFDVSFIIWYALGPLSLFIAEDLQLSATEKGLLVATPILAGAAFRILWGILGDHLGPRRAGLIGIGITFLPLLLGWLWADSLSSVMLVAVLLGVPGASFAISLPMASQWYPPKYQGLAMGIAGAGNSGTILAALFLPRIATAYGWHNAMALAMIPLALMALTFLLCAKDCPHRPKPRQLGDYVSVFKEMDTLWFCFFYSITFGGFIGLASFLSIFFCDQFNVPKVTAGDLTAICVFAGSFMRPVGGLLADKFGGLRILPLIYSLTGVLLLMLATLPSMKMSTILFFGTLATLGAGNGAVFQLVARRFKSNLGLMTGLVGAAGGIGGFMLPAMFGKLRDITGSYSSGLVVFSIVCIWALTLLLAVQTTWRLTWAAEKQASTT